MAGSRYRPPVKFPQNSAKFVSGLHFLLLELGPICYSKMIMYCFKCPEDGERKERATDAEATHGGIIYGVSPFQESGREASAGQNWDMGCERVEYL